MQALARNSANATASIRSWSMRSHPTTMKLIRILLKRSSLKQQTRSLARAPVPAEDLEAYIKRIRSLEEMSMSFEGVQQAFAIQAGREVRILVKPDQIDDLSSARLARDIAKKIEETMQYPGQIRVTVIRETRSTEYAK